MRKSSQVRRPASFVVAVALAAGTIGLTASVASAHAGANRSVHSPTVLHGHTCTVVASGRHRKVVGHAGDVVCGLRGNDTLTAVGPGTVYLIAGRGRDKLVASNDPNAHDVLVAGTGRDTIVTGTGGDDIVEEGPGTDTITCGTGGSVTVVDDNSASDTQGDSSAGSASESNKANGTQGSGTGTGQGDSQDCQGDNGDQSATLEFEGTITALPTPTTMTVQWSDVSNGAQAWLDSQTPADPAVVTFDVSTATVEVDGGGPLAVGYDVEVAANPPSSGTTLQAVDVQASAGG